MASKFLTAEWRKLAIANYSVDPKILTPYLPYKTELDLWNGKCYVSLVGFRFINTKLKGISIPFHRHFEEVNLRFYVRYKDSTGWKRGVTFIKEIVPKPALTFIANTIYKEKYITLPMKHHWEMHDDLISIAYSWKLDRWNSFSLKADPVPMEIKANSEEEFITEHYWGYSSVDKNKTGEYEVAHTRWNIYPVETHNIDCDFKKLYGDDFDILNNRQPASVFLAEGSPVTIFTKKIL